MSNTSVTGVAEIIAKTLYANKVHPEVGLAAMAMVMCTSGIQNNLSKESMVRALSNSYDIIERELAYIPRDKSKEH